MTRRTLAALALVLTAGTAAAEDRTAAFVDAQGKEIGSASFRSTPVGVLIALDVVGLLPGAHAVHIHAVGA